jgi:GLPGLI family protein
MKTIIPLLCLVILPVTLKSQDQAGKSITSGKITFQEKVKLEIKLEGDAAQFADQLPKEQINTRILYFDQENSLYLAEAAKNDDEEEMTQQGGGMRIKMVNRGASDKIYCDFKDKKKIEQKEFMTRMFLVEGDLAATRWKFTGNSLSILGYNCQEVISEDTTRKVKAWFTAAIPIPAGPAGFGNLPGMILQLDIADGKRLITASAIDPSFNNQGEIVKPKEGKKVTSDEFKKIVDDKMKEMGVENGEGTNHVIIRINN